MQNLERPMTKLEKFKIKLSQHPSKYISTVDIDKIGIEMYYTRATRSARLLAQRGKLRRIPDEEAMLMGLVRDGDAQLAWYERPGRII